MSWIQSRPPLATFYAALFFFAATLFILGLIVNSRDDVVNPDILSWNVFFSKVSKLDFCFEHKSVNETRTKREAKMTTVASFEANNNKTLRANVSVSVPFTAQFVRSIHDLVGGNSLMPSGSEEPILASGGVRLGHLEQSSFGKYTDMPLSMSLLLPAPLPPGSSGDQDVCVLLEAPQELLDDLNSGHVTPAGCSFLSVQQAKPVRFVTHTRDHLPDAWCANGTVVDVVYEDQPTWMVYVSAEDRALVHYHLMAMSAFLFVLTGLGVGLAFMKCFKGGKSNSSTSKSVGDRRGDMELLSQDAYED